MKPDRIDKSSETTASKRLRREATEANANEAAKELKAEDQVAEQYIGRRRALLLLTSYTDSFVD